MPVLMLQPAAPPGRDTSNASPPPPASVAPGASQQAPAPIGGPSGGGGLVGNLVVMAPILIMVVVLFFVSRADRKKRTELEAKLKKGDRVVTRSGLIGKLTDLGERTVKVEIAPGVTVTMVKTAIEGLDGGDSVATTKADDKAKDGGKSDDKPASDSKKK